MADSVKQRAREFTEKAANVVANTYMIGALSYQGHRPKEMVPKLIEMILPSMADFAASEYDRGKREGWEAGIEAAAKQFEHTPGQHDDGNTEKYCDTCETIAVIRSLKFEESK